MKKSAVLIYGMHRSGTSAIAGFVHSCGATIGEKKMRADKDNENGYFENLEVFYLNNEILNFNNTYWADQERLAQSINIETNQSFRKKAIEVIRSEFAEESLILIKDPQLSFTQAIWKEALETLDYEIFSIICIRNPFEVAESLRKRNGFSLKRSHSLYFSYLSSAILNCQKHDLLLVDYKEVIEDPLGVVQKLKLKISVLKKGPSDVQYIKESVFRASLYNNRKKPSTDEVKAENSNELYEALRIKSGDDKLYLRVKNLYEKVRGQLNKRKENLISKEYLSHLKGVIEDYKKEQLKRGRLHEEYAAAKSIEILQLSNHISAYQEEQFKRDALHQEYARAKENEYKILSRLNEEILSKKSDSNEIIEFLDQKLVSQMLQNGESLKSSYNEIITLKGIMTKVASIEDERKKVLTDIIQSSKEIALQTEKTTELISGAFAELSKENGDLKLRLSDIKNRIDLLIRANEKSVFERAMRWIADLFRS